MAVAFPVGTKRSAIPFVGRRGALAQALLWVQGSYWLVTGVWPLVSIRTFQWVTGPKTDHLPTGREADHWLVMTAGVLITSIALALLTAAWRRRVSPEIVALAVASAIGLTGIDVIYVARGVIAPIYLLDAAIEVLLLAGWATALVFERAGRRAGNGTDYD
jgi:hypothetical protein